MYNVGAFMDLMMTVVKFCMTEKIQQRVRYTNLVYLDTLELHAVLNSSFRRRM